MAHAGVRTSRLPLRVPCKKALNGSYKTARYTLQVTELPNGTYYLKNKQTERNADIENQSMSDGTQIHQWEFHGGKSQRWEFRHLGDGYYSVKSDNASTPYYLGVSGDSSAYDAAVVLRTGSLTSGMKWKISVTQSGAYKITPRTGEANNRVLAIGAYQTNMDGINIQQRNYVEDENFKDEWLLHEFRDYTLMYIGYIVGDPLMPPIVDAVSSALTNKAGMDGYGYTSLTTKELRVHLASTTIFSCITHGEPTKLVTSGGYLDVSDINSLGDDAFDHLKFVYLGACQTGEGRDNATNLVNAIYSKGADAVLGFTTNVKVKETNLWTREFMLALADGETLFDAMSAADDAVQADVDLSGKPLTTTSDYRYLKGSAQMAPCN